MSVVSSRFVVFTNSVFRNVSVVVSLHLVVEDLGFRVGGFLKEFGVDQVQDCLAIIIEFLLNLAFVSSEESKML